MMGNITRLYFVLAIVALGAMSCHRELEFPQVTELPEIEGDGIALKLDVGGMSLTRVDADTRPGDDDGSFNENVLGSAVDVFFFPEGATDSDDCTFSTSASVSASETGGNLSIPVNAQRLNTIFNGTAPGSKALVYVVANYNGSTAIDHENGSYTLGALKALPLAKAVWSTFPQERFVMTGSSEITLVDASKSTPASGQIEMRRVASKVTFKLTVADEIVVENIKKDQDGTITERTLETWSPLKDAMTVYLQYAMNYANLGGTPHHVPVNPKSDEAKDSLYTFDPNKLAASANTIDRNRTIIDRIEPPAEEGGEWTLVTHDAIVPVPVYDTKVQNLSTDGPFYSYPVTWEPGVQTEPFIKLIIPWNNGSRTKYYYYKVPFSVSELESNNWYEVTLDVQILGGEDEQPIPLTATYKIVDWVPGTTSEASVVNARYLSVTKTEWIMYNTEELTIPITSSHDVQIVGYQVKSNGTGVNRAFATADKYSNGEPRDGAWIGSDPSIYNPFTDNLVTTGVTSATTVGTINGAKPNYGGNDPAGTTVSATSWFQTADITRDHIILRHNLNNDTSTDDYDVAPYYIRIRVRHKDDYSYYKDIIIEQRPAIIIEPQRNTAGVTDDNHGYVWIDNSTSTNADDWKERSPITGDNNKNPNMYIISTSVLPASSTRVIGDPRSLTPKAASALVSGWNQSSQGPFVDGTNNHRLTNYYQTDITNEAQNTIAPSFRIASSHGKSSPMTYSDALRRCASYQEDGYPAGRWRLPTMAEVLFITTLSSDGKIPELFTFDSSGWDEGYWCSTGKIDGHNGIPEFIEGTTANGDWSTNYSGKRWVRCVYDEWFWENTTHATVNRNTFTWGDQTRESVVRTKAAE